MGGGGDDSWGGDRFGGVGNAQMPSFRKIISTKNVKSLNIDGRVK